MKTKTMTALRAHVRGGAGRLAPEQVPVPDPGPGEVLVAVHAAAVTLAELTWDLSWTTRDGADRTPVIPSHEVSGTVAALGDGVTDLSVGDEVYGLIDFDRDGAAAEYTVVPADALAPKPDTVSHIQAAAISLTGLTVWQALVEHAALKSGETVLVHGGAGGIGVHAVQLAASLGAHVVATVAPYDADYLRRLGVERVIDYTAERFDRVVSDLDVVLDTVGGSTLERSYDVLRPGGRLVTLGAAPSAQRAGERGIKAEFFVVRPDRGQLKQIAALVDEGELRPVVGRTFPLSAGRQAYGRNRQPHRPGKTVIVVR
jgi:NADPH:quinone reductase-like Zn-dependent oxidoreductase